ncbi:MAG: cryptochrome/photolyase family protein, partial [Verrucomicrobiota bacterium]
LDVPLEVREDRHFLCSISEFEAHANERKSLRMEFFYRAMRKKTGVLMEGAKPAGGRWNFDPENRGSFGKKGPGESPGLPRFEPDAITRDVIKWVERLFPDHPGSLEAFNWPVNRDQALLGLRDFIETRLPRFGEVQDAMWTDEPFLYHALISPALNLKLLTPHEVIEAAEQAWRQDSDRYPLSSVEGFIRQILGWREYVRGVYWLTMPGYLDRNALNAQVDLPDFYWTGDTDMNCLRQVIGQTLRYGYAHHIQRLMVTGLFALLAGVDPKQVHAWYLAVYVDAVEWVELPNTIGMCQYADGGVMASKPYVATGKYIDRMSNYCKSCRYKPGEAVGPEACPFTTLYW